MKNENLTTEVSALRSMNEKIVKLEKMVNDLTSVKQTTLIDSDQNKTISKGGD